MPAAYVEGHFTGDDEGVGDADGEGDRDGEGEADFDGLGELDDETDGERDGDGMTCSVGDVSGVAVGTTAPTEGLLLCLGDDDLVGRVFADSPPFTVFRMLAGTDVPPPVGTARTGAGWESESVTTVAPTPKATASTAATAMATPGLLRLFSDLAGPAAGGNQLYGSNSRG